MKISILHVIFLIMTVIGLKNHVTIIPGILDVAHRDGWASVLFAAIYIFPWLFLVLYIHKKSNQQPIKTWLREKLGKWGSSIVLYVTAVYLLLLALFTLHETILWISVSWLSETPSILILSIYIILIALFIITDIQTIVIVNAFVLFFVVIFGFFVAFTNLQYKEYTMLLPMFEYGFGPALKASLFPAGGFAELIFLLFIQHHFKERLKWYHLTIMLFILVGLTMGPLIGAISIYGPEEASQLRYPAYEEWAMASLGRFVEHLDFFSVYQWLTGTFIRVGIILFIVADILNIAGDKNRIWTYLVPPFFILNLIFFLFDDSYFLQINENEFLISTFIFCVLLSIIIALATMKSGKKNGSNVQHSQTSNPIITEGSEIDWTQNSNNNSGNSNFNNNMGNNQINNNSNMGNNPFNSNNNMGNNQFNNNNMGNNQFNNNNMGNNQFNNNNMGNNPFNINNNMGNNQVNNNSNMGNNQVNNSNMGNNQVNNNNFNSLGTNSNNFSNINNNNFSNINNNNSSNMNNQINNSNFSSNNQGSNINYNKFNNIMNNSNQANNNFNSNQINNNFNSSNQTNNSNTNNQTSSNNFNNNQINSNINSNNQANSNNNFNNNNQINSSNQANNSNTNNQTNSNNNQINNRNTNNQANNNQTNNNQ
nr:endospore germination permease [Lysinibacillus composti]